MKTLNNLTALAAVVGTLMLGACARHEHPPNTTNAARPTRSRAPVPTRNMAWCSPSRWCPRDSATSTIGAGTIAGAVVGGVLGHQVGGGTGNTAATVLGAAGGAYAGHELEKRNQAQQTNVYQLTVRLNNGTYQTITQANSNDIRVGDSVRIDNGVATRY